MKIDPSLDDDGKLYQRFLNKRINANHEGLKFCLDFEAFCHLMRKAGIKSSDCGVKGYHLSRSGDKGDYTLKNCNFVWFTENLLTKQTTEKARAASSKNLTKYNQVKNEDLSLKEEHRQKVLNGMAGYNAERKLKAAERRKVREENAHPSYAGVRNSQAGSFWITNGFQNKKWRSQMGSLPRGYRKGRIL
jgi:hypothetical protein